MTTTLEAVNRILRGCGEPAVTSIIAGSDAEEAQTILGEHNRQVQMEGWAPNVELGVTVDLPDRTVSSTTGSGTFTYDEVVTQETTLATGYFKYEASGVIYLVHIQGTWNATDDINGATASRDLTTATAEITEAKHAAPSSWLQATPASTEYQRWSINAGYLYDTVENTTTWSTNVVVDRVVERTFTDLPDWLANYIIARASVFFQEYKKLGGRDDQVLRNQLEAARAAARREDQKLRKFSIISGTHGDDVRGNRAPVGRWF